MTRPSRTGCGFSLIEALVALSLIAALVAILLPVLNQTRATAMDANCRANLRTLQQGWAVYMSESQSTIPYTRTTTRHPNWWDAMDWVYEDAPTVWADRAGTFNTCPMVQRRYPEIFYRTARWGYAINVWWSNEGEINDQLNEWKNWDAIWQPSQYPWFMDPDVVPWGSAYLASHYAPNTLSNFGAPNWGVGAQHQERTQANVSFADGSVRSVPITEIRAETAGPNQFTWFKNR